MNAESDVILVSDQEASPEVAAVYQRIREGFQIDFVPNFFRAQAVVPHVLEATWHTVDKILVDGPHLPRALKEMMFVAISNANHCAYCESAHLAFCKVFGVDEVTRNKLVGDLEAIAPERSREIVKFAVRVAASPSQVTPESVAQLRARGISPEEISEAIAMAAFANYANAVADGFRVPIDDDFMAILAS